MIKRIANEMRQMTNDESRITVSFLGTNGWYDTRTGNTICTLIETGREYIVLDAGNGLYKLDKYITNGKPIYLFISHLHLDHIIGLHVLNKFRFKQGLEIVGGRRTIKYLRKFIGRPYTMSIKDLPMKVRLTDVRARKLRRSFDLRTSLMRHNEHCLGFRFDLGGKVVTYCPDTAYCENAVRLARSADLLLAECAYPPGFQFAGWPHLNPETGAKLAKTAGVKRLVLTHFDAEMYPELKDRSRAQKIARKIFKRTRTARDGLEVTL